MMRIFMTSGSFTWSVEFNERPDGSDKMLFPRENAVLTVFGGRPSSGRRRVSSLSHRASTHSGWGHGAQGCNDTSFSLP
jgi:hypothetical protein